MVAKQHDRLDAGPASEFSEAPLIALDNRSDLVIVHFGKIRVMTGMLDHNLVGAVTADHHVQTGHEMPRRGIRRQRGKLVGNDAYTPARGLVAARFGDNTGELRFISRTEGASRFKPRHMIAPRLVEPLVWPQATLRRTGLFFPAPQISHRHDLGGHPLFLIARV